MDKDKTYTCCICGRETKGHGNDPWPVRAEGKCCDACNWTTVLPERARLSSEERKEGGR